MPAEQIHLVDKRLDPDKMIFEGVNTEGEPHFTVSECASFFFGRSPHWIRWLEQQHKFILDGDADCPHYEWVTRRGKQEVKTWISRGKCKKCEGRLVGTRKTKKGQRDYTLGDIEEMAHALAQNAAISGTQLTNALQALHIEGKIWEKI